MRIRKCQICNREFRSRNGVSVCSDHCYDIRKKQNEKRCAERKQSGIINTPIRKICPECGKHFESIRTKYCSSECSNSARAKVRKKVFNEYYINNRELHIKNVINNTMERKLRNGDVRNDNVG